MKSLYFLPYSMVSGSVSALQKQVGGYKIKTKGSQYKFKPNHLLVVWGHGAIPSWGGSVPASKKVLNHWSKINKAINKLTAFQAFKAAGVKTPLWTSSMEEAKKWAEKGCVVFCRTLLSSSKGNGIVIATKASEVVPAKLYTKLFAKDKEYRVHVFNGEIIDYVQKKLKHGEASKPDHSPYIRNTANGWVFAREGVTISQAVKDEALKAISALGLDFGAVDLAVNKQGVVVFEVNTAPGLEGTTVSRYSDAIKKYLSQLN